MISPDRGALLARLNQRANALSRAAIYVGGAMTLASVLLISFDVITRKFLGFTTGGADELSSYAFAISTSWAFAYAALQRANVRIDFIYEHLPVRVAAVVDWIALVALATFIAVLTWYAWDVMHTSWVQKSHANTPLATPLWLPQGLWVAGLVWMCVVLALMLVRASVALATGDRLLMHEICGVRSQQQEADEEADIGSRIVEAERS
jgi:TRAP-type C4-dicarboxylate transport system permease small subunit